MHARSFLSWAGLVLLTGAGAGAGDLPPLPATPQKPLAEKYHGVKVVDDYAWLENWDDEAVKKWSRDQNARARAFLDALPQRPGIQRRLKELYTGVSRDYGALNFRGGQLFALKPQPPMEQPLLVVLKSADDPDSEKIILDLNQLNAKGTTAIDFFEPSLDGKLVAVSLSEKGSEMGTVHVYEVATGRERGDQIPRVNGPTAGGSVTWNADGSGFFYTRYPRGNDRPKEDMDFFQQVYFHKLGDGTEKDQYAIGKDFPRIAEIKLDTSDDGKHFLATVANGDGGEYAHYVSTGQGDWRQVTRFEDKIAHAFLGLKNDLYLLSRQNALRGKLLRVDLDRPELARAKIVIPEGDAVLEGLVATDAKLFVPEMVGGPSRIRVFDLDGKQPHTVPIKKISAVGGLLHLTGNEILFRNESFTEPGAWFRYSPDQKEPQRTALFVTAPVNIG